MQATIIYNFRSRSESMVHRNYYHYSGGRFDNHAFFTRMISAHYYFTGEFAVSRPGKYAYQFSGGFIRKHNRLGITVWSLEPEFMAPFGRITSKTSGFPSNCLGFRLRLYFRPSFRWSLNLAWTLENDLYRPVDSSFPGYKRQFLFKLQVRTSSETNLIIRYQHDRKLSRTFLQKLRVNLETRISNDLRYRSRVELSSNKNWSHRIGFAMFQDLRWQMNRLIQIMTRVSFFHTWDYSLRVYEFENDVPGVLRTVPLYGSGNKWYILLQIEPLENFSVWLRIRRITMDDVDSIGSGNDLIEGNIKTEFRLQLRYQY